MGVSTILQQHDHQTAVPLAQAIGWELRRRRTRAGLTQGEIGTPFTRAFVCAVERGRVVPSIPALAVILRNLDVGLDEFFAGVQSQMTVLYSPDHVDPHEAPARHRRRHPPRQCHRGPHQARPVGGRSDPGRPGR